MKHFRLIVKSGLVFGIDQYWLVSNASAINHHHANKPWVEHYSSMGDYDLQILY